MVPGFWKDERVARLRQGATDKLSASQIAKTIGDGCTRSAVIGYAHRHKIALNAQVRISAESKQRHRSERIAKLKKRLTIFDAQSKRLEHARGEKHRLIANKISALEAEGRAE